MNIDARLKTLGLELPTPTKVVANYVPFVQIGQLLFLSGQLPFVDGKLTFTGLVGGNVSVDEAALQARLCAINLISQMRAACDGDLDRVKRVAKITGFVACDSQFKDHAVVVNGASNLLVEVFGEAGRHARSSVGVASLPLNAVVEVEAIIEIA